MAKNNATIYECENCGAISPRWQGRCFSCGSWNTLEKRVQRNKSYKTQMVSGALSSPLNTISADQISRIKSSMDGVDRVLGGGLVPGSAVLLGGEPGVGKSTLLLQYADAMSTGDIYYFSAEESQQQISLRAKRLGIKNTKSIHIANTDSLESILATLEELSTLPALVIVDSIQTFREDQNESKSGSISQVQGVTHQLVQHAKATGIPMVLVGQVTKGGNLAGPKTIEHLVDVVMYLEAFSDRRILSTVKNRFGSVYEASIFSFNEKGLTEDADLEIASGSAKEAKQGSVATIIKEGARYVPMRVQALTVPSYGQKPRRVPTGIDYNRLLLLLAILEKHTQNQFYKNDVFVTVSEGARVHETAADIAICVALASSLKNKPIAGEVAIWGELTLLGELVPVPGQQEREKEASRRGFATIVHPGNTRTIHEVLERVQLVRHKTK